MCLHTRIIVWVFLYLNTDNWHVHVLINSVCCVKPGDHLSLMEREAKIVLYMLGMAPDGMIYLATTHVILFVKSSKAFNNMFKFLTIQWKRHISFILMILVNNTLYYIEGAFSKFQLPHGVVRVFVSFCVLVFCTGHFVMVPLNLTYLHCLQHFSFEHLFNLYLLF